MGEHEHENVQNPEQNENVQNAEPSEEEVDSGNKVEVENPGDAPQGNTQEATQGTQEGATPA